MQIKETNHYFLKTLEGVDPLEEVESSYQAVQVGEHEFFGRVMALDGIPSIASKTSYRYYETAAHSALCTHPEASRVLIIGGGNGGLATEVLRHSEIARIDVVEIDEKVVDLSKKYFSDQAAAFDDERVTLHHQDGYEFVRDAEDDSYDIILIDALDALGNSVNFDKVFFAHAGRILTDKGILSCRAEDIDLDEDAYKTRLETAAEVFRFALPYQANDLLALSGRISMIFASKHYHPTADLLVQRADMLEDLSFYNTDTHKANFALGNDTFKRLLESMKI